VRDAVADVARIAVEQQHMAEPGRSARRHPPAVEPLAVLGRDLHVGERNAGLGGERPGGEVQQRVQEQAEHNCH
jgi:hypothetical protein